MQRNKEQKLLQQYGIVTKEKRDWRDYVKQYKNLNTIHNDPSIPEMYKGYPRNNAKYNSKYIKL